jgi:hypothetical protein
MKITFSTIVFNNNVEINLLKLQAYSFKYVDFEMIDNIFIIYNDYGKRNMKDIIEYYPKELQKKVVVIYYCDMNLHTDFLKEGWQLQQLIKLYISKIIHSEYYCVLDAKNHFLKKMNMNDFFDTENNYYIFTSCGALTYNYYMKNCLQYFSLDVKYYEKYCKNNDKLISMSTPFIFETQVVKDLMLYIEERENTIFEKYFMNNKNITEFYLYGAYLLTNCEKVNYRFKEIIHTSIHKNPNEEWSQNFINNELYKENNWKIFGLHRVAPYEMTYEYKSNVMKMYNLFYINDKEIIKFIENTILFTTL